jgi:hypothetical protein
MNPINQILSGLCSSLLLSLGCEHAANQAIFRSDKIRSDWSAANSHEVRPPDFTVLPTNLLES